MLFNLLFLFNFLLAPMAASTTPKTIYDFKVAALDGSIIDLSQYKGKKIMIVNTASKCGYTPQYEGLEKLSKKYEGKMVIVGFPANNFGSQEPGTNGEIQTFCMKNYGVTFPMAAKISVKGDDMAPIYHWLTEKSRNGKMDSEVKWNFQKYLLNEKGELVEMFPSAVTPEDPKVIAAIEK